eukprot:g789.t1
MASSLSGLRSSSKDPFHFGKGVPFVPHHPNERRKSMVEEFNVSELWNSGYFGSGVKVAVMDTGIKENHSHFKYLKERTNWTDQNSSADGVGHGTFCVGMIASTHRDCLGFAPESEIYTFKVFTDAQVSYSSWFLDALNYALYLKVDVLNLSIGGPDWRDAPFVEKMWELSGSGTVVISAIGNDGPLYGTHMNPAEHLEVIGVGGVTDQGAMASFSSRGVTKHEFPYGYGRVKPDVVVYARHLRASSIQEKCIQLSGTSVASPVVAGAISLLMSIPRVDKKRWNPAIMKQALIETAQELPDINIFEQGSGMMNLVGAADYLLSYPTQGKATAFPSMLDLTDCPYMWPYCRQPLYASAMPIVANITLLNGMGSHGYFDGVPVWEGKSNGDRISVETKQPHVLWPFSGWLGVFITVPETAKNWSGIVTGALRFTIVSPSVLGDTVPRRSEVILPIMAKVVPTPKRQKRILWDQWHNIGYPPGYISRDDLLQRKDMLDWNGDHLHTNFKGVFDNLIDEGFFIEILSTDFRCFDAENYGALLLVDPEEEFLPEEIIKLESDIREKGLSFIVFSEWYSTDVSKASIGFFDDNTRVWWDPILGGGSNVPALNDILAPFGIALSNQVYDGDVILPHVKRRFQYSSGGSIARFPKGGKLFKADLRDFGTALINNPETRRNGKLKRGIPILGMLDVEESGGRIFVMGDSACIDNANLKLPCWWLLRGIVKWSVGEIDSVEELEVKALQEEFVEKGMLPVRLGDLPPFNGKEDPLRRYSKAAILNCKNPPQHSWVRVTPDCLEHMGKGRTGSALTCNLARP